MERTYPWNWNPNESQRKLFNDWIELVVGHLAVCREGVPPRSLSHELLESAGEEIPLARMGFRSVNQFLYEMRDHLEVRKYEGNLYVFIRPSMVPEGMRHIRQQVLGQNKGKGPRNKSANRRPDSRRATFVYPKELLAVIRQFPTNDPLLEESEVYEEPPEQRPAATRNNPRSTRSYGKPFYGRRYYPDLDDQCDDGGYDYGDSHSSDDEYDYYVTQTAVSTVTYQEAASAEKLVAAGSSGFTPSSTVGPAVVPAATESDPDDGWEMTYARKDLEIAQYTSVKLTAKSVEDSTREWINAVTAAHTELVQLTGTSNEMPPNMDTWMTSRGTIVFVSQKALLKRQHEYDSEDSWDDWPIKTKDPEVAVASAEMKLSELPANQPRIAQSEKSMPKGTTVPETKSEDTFDGTNALKTPNPSAVEGKCKTSQNQSLDENTQYEEATGNISRCDTMTSSLNSMVFLTDIEEEFSTPLDSPERVAQLRNGVRKALFDCRESSQGIVHDRVGPSEASDCSTSGSISESDWRKALTSTPIIKESANVECANDAPGDIKAATCSEKVDREIHQEASVDPSENQNHWTCDEILSFFQAQGPIFLLPDDPRNLYDYLMKYLPPKKT